MNSIKVDRAPEYDKPRYPAWRDATGRIFYFGAARQPIVVAEWGTVIDATEWTITGSPGIYS